jgi:ABC-type nitrate/sulfonate/bicarbonate transport system substrate-binding protein
VPHTRKEYRMSRFVLALGIAAILVIGACSQGADPEPTDSASEAIELQDITLNYASRTGSPWIMFIAKEGGYYEKYGLNAELVFGVHPAGIAMVVSGQAQMSVYTLQQSMIAASRDGSMAMVGSPYKKSLFALIAGEGIEEVSDLAGKTIAVSQIGDAPYNYATGLLRIFGLTPDDVEWTPIGTDVNGRAAALVSGRVDATMLTAPVYFRVEDEGYRVLANISDYDEIYAPTTYLFLKDFVEENPAVPEQLIKAHAEAIWRYYDDKGFAVDTYLAYNDQDGRADIERMYDRYAGTNTFERVPYVLDAAVQYLIDNAPDDEIAEQMATFDFTDVIDNSIVARLVDEGFFEHLYGAEIQAEQDEKAGAAFGR